jgi:hypothetical protein
MQAERADQDGRKHEDGSPEGRALSIGRIRFTTAISAGACQKNKGFVGYISANPLSCFPRYDRSQPMLVQDFGPLAE